MKAIIPAAGHGTRFLPVTKAVPKEMLPIGAKPALELIVDEARSAGADEIVLVISEGKELIRRYFEDRSDIRFVYQKEQKGLGHAVLQAEVDDDVRGRVFSLYDMAFNVAFVVAAGLAVLVLPASGRSAPALLVCAAGLAATAGAVARSRGPAV